MCDPKGSSSGSSKSGGGGGLHNKIKKFVTPTTTSIAKNKAAGAAHTASLQDKGIGVARSNITDSNGKAISGLSNSQTNPALVNLAINGVKGKDGLAALSKAQAASLGKDTSFTGIFNDIVNDTKHKPVESLLQFGTRTMQEKDAEIKRMLDGGSSVNGGAGGSYTNYKGSGPSDDPRGENNVHTNYSSNISQNAVPSGFNGAVGGGVVPPVGDPKPPVPPVVPPVVKEEGAVTKKAVPVADTSLGGGANNSNSALANKNSLAIARNRRAKSRRKYLRSGTAVAGGGNTSLNIPT
jgi:hypothetical protein